MLTEPERFGGSRCRRRRPRRRRRSCRSCKKDFHVAESSSIEARCLGASAALLIVRALEPGLFRELLEAARAVDLEIVVEVRDDARARSARSAPVRDIIGVNNRNLETLVIEHGTAETLIPRIPPGVVAIAESGYDDRAGDRARCSRAAPTPCSSARSSPRRLIPAAEVDRLAEVRESRSWLSETGTPRHAASPLIKFCGMTRAEDASAAARLGAAYVGVIFADESAPGRRSRPRASVFAAAGPGIAKVAVFSGGAIEDIAAVAERVAADVVQLHGDIGPATIEALRARFAGKIWAVATVDPDGTLAESASGRARDGGRRVLLDTRVSGKAGGTGVTFDWTQLVDDRRACPTRDD